MNMVYQTNRLILKILTPEYVREVLAFQMRNQELFERYEPARPADFYTHAHQNMIMKCEFKLATKLTTIRYYVFLPHDPRTIIGTVCLHNVQKAPYHCCEIGYKFDASYQHQGYAREAVQKILEVAFSDLRLHKVFARVMPENTASIRLLHSLSFVDEGIEHDCTLIRGRWEDHLRLSLISPFDRPNVQNLTPQYTDTNSQNG